MYQCNNCGERGFVPNIVRESHGLPSYWAEELECCPYCHVADVVLLDEEDEDEGSI